MSLKQVKLRRAEPEPEAGPTSGPGPRLRDARKARGIDHTQAADQLKLSSSVLETIERDDYSELPDSIYVRGYVTGYARMLGLPEDEILAEYRAFRGESTTPSLAAPNTIKQQARSSDAGVRWVSYGLVLMRIAVVGWWGYEQLRVEQDQPQASMAPATGSDALPMTGSDALKEPMERQLEQSRTVDMPAPDAPTSNAAAAPPTESSPPQASVDAEPPPVSDAVTVEGGELDAAPMVAEDELAIQPTLEASAVEPNPQSSAEAEGAVIDQAPQSPMIVGGARLEMLFERDCWIEVRDAQGTKLAFGLAKAGSFREVVGEPPFRVLLGDSGAVVLLLNGVTVAAADYGAADGRPARFTLGGS